jgi:hypothetical protein
VVTPVGGLVAVADGGRVGGGGVAEGVGGREVADGVGGVRDGVCRTADGVTVADGGIVDDGTLVRDGALVADGVGVGEGRRVDVEVGVLEGAAWVGGGVRVDVSVGGKRVDVADGGRVSVRVGARVGSRVGVDDGRMIAAEVGWPGREVARRTIERVGVGLTVAPLVAV